jgi:hypothetical protein
VPAGGFSLDSVNRRLEERAAASISEVDRPAACLNMRPKPLTVSTQFDRSNPSRSRIGARRSGIAKFIELAKTSRSSGYWSAVLQHAGANSSAVVGGRDRARVSGWRWFPFLRDIMRTDGGPVIIAVSLPPMDSRVATFGPIVRLPGRGLRQSK